LLVEKQQQKKIANRYIQCTEVAGGSRVEAFEAEVVPAALSADECEELLLLLVVGASGRAGGSVGKFCMGARAIPRGMLLVPDSRAEVLSGPGVAVKPRELERCN
jgi:hypothetical protein